MNLNLTDKVYIVTGGASGIGEAVCRLIAEEGGIVVVADRNKDKGQALCNDILNHQQKAYAVPVDLTDEAAIRRLTENVMDKYNRLDGLIINAGGNDYISLENGSLKGFQQSSTINLIHYYAMVHYALPHLKKSKGAIVNVDSKISVTGQSGSFRYAAKKGVDALTREWAVELLPYSIRVNTVIPAETDTPVYTSWLQPQPDPEEKLKHIPAHIPFQKRFTTPEEIANTVVFLLSDASSHTTGQIIFADGGYTHLERMLL